MSTKKLSYAFIVLNLILLAPNVPHFIIALCVATLLLIFLSNKFKAMIDILKVVFLILAIGLLFKQFKTMLVVEFGVSFVLILSFLKALELESINDFFNMFLILTLSEACIFIINPNSSFFIIGIIKIGFFFYFLLKMRNYSFAALNLKKLLTLVLPATVFSLLMFFTFPRFTQGFININNPSYLFSGSNHELKFRDLGPITLSDKEVFKVINFPLNQVSLNALYWRTNVLWDFRKGSWRTSYAQLKKNYYDIDTFSEKNTTFNYQIKMPIQYVDFIPHFDAESTLKLDNYNFNYYSESTFKLSPGLMRAFSFNFSSQIKHEKNNFNDIQKRKGLTLISDKLSLIKKTLIGNTEESNLNLQEKINLINHFFNSKNYIYSISPPSYESLEDFILNGKIGYCSHFASAYAYLLRALDIPSRVIIGYMGGEVNSFDDSIVIKEKDAHAWVEYYNGTKWLRIDPTELVAPTRISEGSNRFYDNLNPYIGNSYYKIPKSWVRFAAIEKITQLSDYLENQLSSNLFNFDREDQLKFFKTNGGVYFVIIIILFMGCAFFISRYSKRVVLTDEEKKYFAYLKEMDKLNLIKLKHETATEFFIRASTAHPDLTKKHQVTIENYINRLYRQ